VDVPVLDNDVAEVDADPKRNPLSLRYPGIAFEHPPLHSERAGDRFDDARELDQKAIAGRFDDAPAMVADFGVDQFSPMRFQPREGVFFVGLHEPAVARDIRGENGGQPAFDALRGQSGAP
jgi:hypothetical protein